MKKIILAVLAALGVMLMASSSAGQNVKISQAKSGSITVFDAVTAQTYSSDIDVSGFEALNIMVLIGESCTTYTAEVSVISSDTPAGGTRYSDTVASFKPVADSTNFYVVGPPLFKYVRFLASPQGAGCTITVFAVGVPISSAQLVQGTKAVDDRITSYDRPVLLGGKCPSGTCTTDQVKNVIVDASGRLACYSTADAPNVIAGLDENDAQETMLVSGESSVMAGAVAVAAYNSATSRPEPMRKDDPGRLFTVPPLMGRHELISSMTTNVNADGGLLTASATPAGCEDWWECTGDVYVLLQSTAIYAQPAGNSLDDPESATNGERVLTGWTRRFEDRTTPNDAGVAGSALFSMRAVTGAPNCSVKRFCYRTVNNESESAY